LERDLQNIDILSPQDCILESAPDTIVRRLPEGPEYSAYFPIINYSLDERAERRQQEGLLNPGDPIISEIGAEPGVLSLSLFGWYKFLRDEGDVRSALAVLDMGMSWGKNSIINGDQYTNLAIAAARYESSDLAYAIVCDVVRMLSGVQAFWSDRVIPNDKSMPFRKGECDALWLKRAAAMHRAVRNFGLPFGDDCTAHELLFRQLVEESLDYFDAPETQVILDYPLASHALSYSTRIHQYLAKASLRFAGAGEKQWSDRLLFFLGKSRRPDELTFKYTNKLGESAMLT
jgi:hypothetical protein